MDIVPHPVLDVTMSVDLLRHIIGSLSKLTLCVNFRFNPSGLFVQTMDSSRVALCQIELPKSDFQEFSCTRPLPVGLNVAVVAKILACQAKMDVCTLICSDGSDFITLSFIGDTDQCVYEVPLMSIDSEDPTIPSDMVYDAEALLLSTLFAKQIKDCSVIGERVSISMTEPTLCLRTKGDLGTFQVESTGEACIVCGEHTGFPYSTRFLCLFTAATPMSDKVRLSLSNDMPLCVSYVCGKGGRMDLYLAPCCEE
jgi:proliferating cell nuclear antigen